MQQQISEAAAYVRARHAPTPRLGLILGSGLSDLAERVTRPITIPYAEIPHFVPPGVSGHAGTLYAGLLGGLPVMVLQGRAHYYEGHSPERITFPVRVLRALGAETLVVTNAAGGLRSGMRAGDLMAIGDHINLVGLAGHHPLRGPNDDRLGPRFPDLSCAYDRELRALLFSAARELDLSLHEGVYVMVAGPSFETPAEVRMLRLCGADAVGMSTAPEVVVARHAGMRVVGVSLISNVAVDSTDAVGPHPSHEEVLEAGRRAAPRLADLLERFMVRYAQTIRE